MLNRTIFFIPIILLAFVAGIILGNHLAGEKISTTQACPDGCFEIESLPSYGFILTATSQGFMVDKTKVRVPELTAKYFTTTYWGEEQRCEAENVTYILRPYKTYELFPDKDLQWVKEEKINGDDVEISLVWDVEGSEAMGVCFDDLSIKNTRYDYCALILFQTVDAKLTFLNEFKGDGSNVVGLILTGQNIAPDMFFQSLETQVSGTKDLVAGQELDICSNLWRWGLE